MSMSNLAAALHEELCDVLRCKEDRTYHSYRREFWEGMARRTVEEYTTNIIRNREEEDADDDAPASVEIVYEYSPPRDFGEQIVRRENWPPVSLWQQLGLPAWRRAISRVRNGR